MADFCTCGSLKVNGNCSNKKCNNRNNRANLEASYAQIELIQALKEQVGEDSNIDYNTLTSKEASDIIDDLYDRKELGV